MEQYKLSIDYGEIDISNYKRNVIGSDNNNNGIWGTLDIGNIVKIVIDNVCKALEPFLDKVWEESIYISVKNLIEEVLITSIRTKHLQNFMPIKIIQTPQMKIEDKVQIILTFTPVFELQYFTILINLSKGENK